MVQSRAHFPVPQCSTPVATSSSLASYAPPTECLVPGSCWTQRLFPPQVPSPEAGRSTRVTVAVVDTFVWQALASVAIPGFTINRVCAASLYVLATATRWPLAVRKWTTTALGLLTIPVIIHPIDRCVPSGCRAYPLCRWVHTAGFREA